MCAAFRYFPRVVFEHTENFNFFCTINDSCKNFSELVALVSFLWVPREWILRHLTRCTTQPIWPSTALSCFRVSKMGDSWWCVWWYVMVCMVIKRHYKCEVILAPVRIWTFESCYCARYTGRVARVSCGVGDIMKSRTVICSTNVYSKNWKHRPFGTGSRSLICSYIIPSVTPSQLLSASPQFKLFH
jgi:hypothetical protein